MNNLSPNKDIAGTPNASTNNQSVSKKTSLDNVARNADLSATTDGTILNDNGIATALSTTVASTADSLGVAATVTAATADATVPGDSANEKSQKKGKQRNNQRRLHHPLVTIQSARNIWIMLLLIQFPPILRKLRIMCRVMSATGHKQSCATILNLHRRTVSILIAIFLFITYVKLPGSKRKGILTVARYCCLHHPQYKYQNIIERSGVTKKS